VLSRRFENIQIPVLLIDGVVLGDYYHGHYQRWRKTFNGRAYWFY
jgi:hypothetical protein